MWAYRLAKISSKRRPRLIWSTRVVTSASTLSGEGRGMSDRYAAGGSVQWREPRHLLAVVGDRLEEHPQRPRPPAGVVVQRAVHHQRFVRLAVCGDREHLVLAPLEVAVPARPHGHL